MCIRDSDTSAVKQKCRLSLNLAREGEQRAGNISLHSGTGCVSGGLNPMGFGGTSETLHIRSQRDSTNRGRLEQMEVTLSRYADLNNEFFL